ncbi:hypothetical protein CHLRE_13g604300v5 [Chlamydomonas reinhardtii]|uniref:Uncharacterized protein n=1 Tax=Chlamydomonas reinhardtii TaxID=3055 RepID=A8JAW1_CHLRE|nr:uncharacterized protein CHLRE_13g604300v5 [Chlamydomonas reinhardtii]PNW74331.1 hypothetical protein CHLRE_13g604300v5 [Chlamydomonas reinhardtii]|eukprot:XP_001699124.1 predicted protein [Chlamydomonas reinhardtii]
MSGRAKPLLKTAAAGALLGISVYVGADVLGEYTTYTALRDQGLKYAAQDSALVAQIGEPFQDGPWYNASIGFTQSGHIAAVTFPLKGSKQITDVTVRAVRRPGVPSVAIYNLTGGEWKVLDASAMAPQPGGMVKPRSIMPAQAVPKVVDGKVVAGEECEECNQKAKAGSSSGSSDSSGSSSSGSGTTGAPAAATAAAAASGTSLAPEAGGSGAAAAQAAQQQPKRKRFWLF